MFVYISNAVVALESGLVFAVFRRKREDRKHAESASDVTVKAKHAAMVSNPTYQTADVGRGNEPYEAPNQSRDGSRRNHAYEYPQHKPPSGAE